MGTAELRPGEAEGWPSWAIVKAPLILILVAEMVTWKIVCVLDSGKYSGLYAR